MDIVETRRRNLARYIDERHEGNRSEFCRATGKSPNLINLILTKSKEYQKGFGEKLARDIEQKANMPHLWLDSGGTEPDKANVSSPIKVADETLNGSVWLTMDKTLVKKYRNSGSVTMLVTFSVDAAGALTATGNLVQLPVRSR